MKNYTVSKAREHFAEVLDLSITTPVTITKSGKIRAVLINPETYKHFLKLRDNIYYNEHYKR